MTAILYIDGGGPVEVEFLGISNGVGADFGDPSDARTIICSIHAFAAGGDNPSLTSVALGDVSATIFTGAVESPGHPDTGDIGIFWIGGKPTGSSGNITPTFSVATGYRIGVWRVMNLESLTPVDMAASVVPSTSSPFTINADAEDKGVFFGAATIMRASGTALFAAGVTTPDYNQPVVPSDIRIVLGGYDLISANETNRALTVAKTGDPNMRGAIAALSLR